VPVAIKFCGLTRPQDAEQAVALGASYLGVIFAGGPRQLDAQRAREVLAPARDTSLATVGVFGRQAPDEIARAAEQAGVMIIQLHGDPTAEDVLGVRRLAGAAVWGVIRIAGRELPPGHAELFMAADGVVVDSRVVGSLGGSGAAFDWIGVGDEIRAAADERTLILAGGLTPENVQEGIRALRPDVVDVSSGVEARIGEKDHARMAAFVQAARSSIEQ
jgi:phosphoribosylanthranilate isomerase